MQQKALDKPFPVGHKVLLIEPLEESSHVLVEGLPSDQEHVVQLYFGNYGVIKEVEKRADGKFVVSFEDKESKKLLPTII